MADNKPTVTLAPADYDVHGVWNHMTPQTRKLMDSIQQDPTKLKHYVEQQYRMAAFMKYIEEAGTDAFGTAHDHDTGSPALLAEYEIEGITFECELKAGVDSSARLEEVEDAASPVPIGGAQGQFIASTQGDLVFVVQQIDNISLITGKISGALSLVALAMAKLLTKYLTKATGIEANSASQLAEGVLNAAQDGDEAAQDVVNFANALRVVNIATKVFAVVSILSVLVDFFLAVFHKMTYTFSMWNETDVDLEWSLTYTADDTSWLNSDGKSGGNWYPFPKMNNVESGLIPLGGGLDYDKVAAVNLSLANGSKSAAISAVGIHVCIAIRQKGATENVMVVLIDAPLIGDNKMLLDQGKGDESYYNDNIDRATESLSTSFKFQVAGKTLEAKLSTDQNSGETHYGGIGGYNYNALLYIKNASS